jgi:hypothetical protein
METTVRQLLRDFPAARKAALRGETVRIKTREGNLVLTAEKPEKKSILGWGVGLVEEVPGVDLTQPTLPDEFWKPSL